jgi:hypothetical protein
VAFDPHDSSTWERLGEGRGVGKPGGILGCGAAKRRAQPRARKSLKGLTYFFPVEGTLLAWHGSRSIPGHNFDEAAGLAAKDSIIKFEEPRHAPHLFQATVIRLVRSMEASSAIRRCRSTRVARYGYSPRAIQQFVCRKRGIPSLCGD